MCAETSQGDGSQERIGDHGSAGDSGERPDRVGRRGAVRLRV